VEIEEIYFPLAHLIEIHIKNYDEIRNASNAFYQRNQQKLPFIIGIAGSVAVGKSTTARVLQKVLSFLPSKPKVSLVTTDGLRSEDIEEIYFPLAHLIEIHIKNYDEIRNASNAFYQRNQQKLPFIIGIAGSVAVGKSTTARVLQKVLSFLPSKPKVSLVTTDGF